MRPSDAHVTAVLGPTNTGKTHLAVERMCAHSSGMIGFPLRLLAREVYDRVVAMKGAHQVALVTGEERIVPPGARWFLCTAESMPLRGGVRASQGGGGGQEARDLAFVGIDEAQIGADPERGHVFTDRLLHARGREETMILGSEALRPMVRALVPDAEIIGRPRFSTLSYAGAKKISRLPRRSAIVAFSAEEVYAVAEMLRRLRGGAAVVMGALSPRTRNAQVAMFQAGEVDYLVATDAIGMGLNMDVAHVAFASLNKFDGRRQRRLSVAEMAQIAGRAGRHQRDGTFGALVDEGPGAFTPEEIFAVEGHRFPPIERMYWREGDPDLSSVDALVASLERKPPPGVLRAAPEAVDLAVLKRLSEDALVRARTRSRFGVERLWAACSLPDFRKLGVDPHARTIARIFANLTEGDGYIPHRWFADELARLDRVDGDVETIAGRIAAVRTYAYIAQRADWLSDPAHWAERTRMLEERLSDALHASLTQRFVDKRTTALIRRIGTDLGALPVEIAADGEVSVEEHAIGRLDGFRFHVDPAARANDKRMLLAAAEKRLVAERARRADAILAADDARFRLADGAILCGETVIARLAAGSSLARPRVVADTGLESLPAAMRERLRAHAERWLGAALSRALPGVVAAATLARDAEAGAAARSVAAAVEAGAGLAPRLGSRAAVEALDGAGRHRLRTAGVTIGALDLFDPRVLKPAAAPWRQALLAAAGRTLGDLPPAGATVLARAAPGAMLGAGYRPFAGQAVRVDLVERIARAAHDARQGRRPFVPDPALATSIGVEPATFERLMAELGFRAAKGGPGTWIWHGRAPERRVAPQPGNAFAALLELGVG